MSWSRPNYIFGGANGSSISTFSKYTNHLNNSIMRGIQYINDSKGNRTRVVVDLRLYGKEFAAFLEGLNKKHGFILTV